MFGARPRRGVFMDRTEGATFGLTEIRGPCHSFMGSEYLEEILASTLGTVDGMKFVGGSTSLMSHSLLKEMIRVAHKHGIYVSSGCWSEHILNKGRKSFKDYVKECKDLGFDIIEFDTLSERNTEGDLLHLTRMIRNEGLKPKPGFFLQMDDDIQAVIESAERFVGAGAHVIKVETDSDSHATDMIARLIERFGLDKLMFEAAEPRVFDWYIRKYGRGVNLFVDHSHITELELLRSGKWEKSFL